MISCNTPQAQNQIDFLVMKLPTTAQVDETLVDWGFYWPILTIKDRKVHIFHFNLREIPQQTISVSTCE